MEKEIDFYNGDDIIVCKLFDNQFIEIRGLNSQKDIKNKQVIVNIIISYNNNLYLLEVLQESYITYPEFTGFLLSEYKQDNKIFINQLQEIIKEQNKDLYTEMFKNSLEKKLPQKDIKQGHIKTGIKI